MKSKLTLLLLFCGSLHLFAQNQPYYDDRLYHFGFSLGTNLMHFNVHPSMKEQLDEAVYDVRSSGLTPGFTVGAIADLRLHKHLNLRFTPNLSFSSNTLSYKNIDTREQPVDFRYELMTMPVSLPLYLKFSADRLVNYRPYVIAGGGVRYDVGRDKEKSILLQSTDYFLEFGFGCDTYFSFFKFAPELKFAIGFNDLLVPMEQRPDFEVNEDKKYTQAINRLTGSMLTLVFHFE